MMELEARTVEGREGASGAGLWRYVLVGAAFGVVLVKSEAASWYRIHEMFRFESFHMYGILGSAVAVAAAAVALLRRRGIVLPRKELGSGKRYWMGGTVFGIGWGLVGACPGPMFALLGTGMGVMAVAILSALLGTWVYGQVREKLPH